MDFKHSGVFKSNVNGKYQLEIIRRKSMLNRTGRQFMVVCFLLLFAVSVGAKEVKNDPNYVVTVEFRDGTRWSMKDFAFYGLPKRPSVYYGSAQRKAIGGCLIRQGMFFDLVNKDQIQSVLFGNEDTEDTIKLINGKEIKGRIPLEAARLTWLDGGTTVIIGKRKVLGAIGEYEEECRKLKKIDRIVGKKNIFVVEEREGNQYEVSDLQMAHYLGGSLDYRPSYKWPGKIELTVDNTKVSVAMKDIEKISLPDPVSYPEFVEIKMKDGEIAKAEIMYFCLFGKTCTGRIIFVGMSKTKEQEGKRHYLIKTIEFVTPHNENNT